MKNKTLLILFVLFSFLGLKSQMQENSNLEIRYLNSAFTDTLADKNLVVIVLVKTKDSASFPPTINLPPKSTVFENGREKVVMLVPHKNLGVRFEGDKVVENKPIYELIKDKIDLKDLKTSMIIIYSIGKLNYVFNKMSLTPAFTEKGKTMPRIEKRFEFVLKGPSPAGTH